MATFNNGESGSSVRTKINNVLQHADGTASELVINDAGADVNFRVESDTNANALFVDGGTGNVGIGTAVPQDLLSIFKATGQIGARFQNTATGTTATDGSFVGLGVSGGSVNGLNLWTYDSAEMSFGTLNTERMRITNTGNVGIGTSLPQMPLTVNGVVQAISSTGVGIAAGATVTVLTPPRGYSYVNVSTGAGTSYGLLLLVFRSTIGATIVSTIDDRTSGTYSASISGAALQVTNASGGTNVYHASCVNIGYGTGN